MRFWKIIFVLIISIALNVALDQIEFPKKDSLLLYSVCEIKSPNKPGAPGICTKINECYEIEIKIRRDSIYNHTVCGYEGMEEIVCCRWQVIYERKILEMALPEIGIPLINLQTDYKCKVKSSGRNGVLKFFEDCPELTGNINEGEQDFCNHEICKNLVCCPLTDDASLPFNPVCEHVDRPDTEILFRLSINTPCTVKGLNVTGTYQTDCKAYDRNEIPLDNAAVLCIEKYCFEQYCCPVLKPNDTVSCTRRGYHEFPRIEFIGPKCVDSVTNLPGRCRRLNDCPTFRKERRVMDECGKDCCTTFFCCPEELNESQSIFMEKCLEYRSATFRKQFIIETLYKTDKPNTVCSPVYGLQAGGIEATPGAWPHMAALGYTSKEDSSKLLWNCGGSLISEKYILTAAHCLQPRQYGQVKIIRMGSLHLEDVTKSDECAEDFGVKRVIPHPSYNRSSVYHDIGLIELNREVKFNFHMRPICLPSSPEVPYGLIGMGWGALGPGGEKSETLYYGYLDSFSYEECNQSYAFNLNRRILRGIDDETQFCVGSRKTISSSCTGDSGGPIISPVRNAYFADMNEIYGITSFGTVCGFANSPGVYTKVYPYLDWIESEVWPE